MYIEKYVMYLVIVIFVSLVVTNESSEILAVFPIPSMSHQIVFRPITQELAKRGHNVTVITTHPAFLKEKPPANLTEVHIHGLSYSTLRIFLLNTVKGERNDFYAQTKKLIEIFTSLIENQLKSKVVQDVIRNKKFDLFIVEAVARPMIVLSHVLKVPTIQVSSFGSIVGNYEAFGAPQHPLLYHSNRRQKINNLTIWDGLMEVYKNYWYENFYKNYMSVVNVKMKNIFGPDIPSITEGLNNANLLILNIHSIWEGNRPVPTNVIFANNLHQKQEKELSRDLKSFLDSSKKGVIYFSFGSNIVPSMLPLEKVQIMVRVFNQLPYEVLWKWDKDEIPGRAKNIKIAKWFPQTDVLRHPNVKLFITQGGLQSTDEAISAGVPLIGIPMLGDQWLNVEKYVYHKIGIKLEMESLTEQEFKDSIYKVIEDNRYHDNIRRLRSIMHDQPNSTLQRVVWWIEYVLKFEGANHLRAPAASVTWSEFLMLDVVAVILSLVLIIAYLFFLLLSYLCNVIAPNSRLHNKTS